MATKSNEVARLERSNRDLRRQLRVALEAPNREFEKRFTELRDAHLAELDKMQKEHEERMVQVNAQVNTQGGQIMALRQQLSLQNGLRERAEAIAADAQNALIAVSVVIGRNSKLVAGALPLPAPPNGAPQQ